MKTLEVRNIHYRKILRGINLDWRQDEIIALMGINGSGKSTLARLLVGLNDLEQGEIRLVEDGSPSSWGKVRRWQEIGFVGQHPMRQTVGVTVAEELAFGLFNLGWSRQEIGPKVKELVSAVGLSGKEDQSPATLSGGERQRLVTAAILALQPSFLILDEALTMLDARAQEKILKLLKQVREKTGQLWITHDLELAQHADRLLVLDQGRLEDRGCPSKSLVHLVGSEVEHFKSQRVGNAANRSTEFVYSVLEWKQADFAGRLQLNKTVKPGEFIGIVGPSGSGKTTLLESAIGLILPTEGQVYGFGEGLKKESLSRWRKQVRLVMQEAGEYLIGQTAYHEIYYGDTRQELESQKASRLVYLSKFGLTPSVLESEPERLSGGERQRIALAAALRTKPQVLLLDEPLLGLDVLSRKIIQAMISELKTTTILYVTHDLRDILQDADRIWLVEEGRVVLDCAKLNWLQHLEQFQAAGVRC